MSHLGLSKWQPLDDEDDVLVSSYRRLANSSNAVIDKTDLGAGKSRKIRTSALAKSSSVTKKNGTILYNLGRSVNARGLLEFGSCLGVSSLYLALSSNEFSELITVEGCEGTYKAREALFAQYEHQHRFPHIHWIRSSFGDFLDEEETEYDGDFQYDLVYIDGNHRYEPTVEYFTRLKPWCRGGIMVFDDIHWSKEMYRAWKFIKTDEDVKKAFELWQFGIIQL